VHSWCRVGTKSAQTRDRSAAILAYAKTIAKYKSKVGKKRGRRANLVASVKVVYEAERVILA
jgi:hypothetical protein